MKLFGINMWSLLWTVVLHVFQVAALLFVYIALSIELAMYMPVIIPGYDGTSAFGDVQAFLLILLLYDRFYGPYSRLLRDVAKSLTKAKRKRRTE